MIAIAWACVSCCVDEPAHLSCADVGCVCACVSSARVWVVPVHDHVCMHVVCMSGLANPWVFVLFLARGCECWDVRAFA